MRSREQTPGILPETQDGPLWSGNFVVGRPLEEKIAHLLRRAGFGASPSELQEYTALGYEGAVDRLVDYEQIPDTVDLWIGQPGYAAVVPDNQAERYAPNYWLSYAQARWLFRMLHSRRPLQEKMALFWHNQFATGWSKINNAIPWWDATRLMAAVAEEDYFAQMGQIELFRYMALDPFSDLLLEVTRDPAMLYWLDGRLNVKAVPQENYAREVMELFTMGIAAPTGEPNFNEDDVRAAARVFTGWNLVRERGEAVEILGRDRRLDAYTFFYSWRQHDTDDKTFSFPIYPDGTKTIAARKAREGLQDGLDFLTALVNHPSTASRLGLKLYRFFVNDVDPPTGAVSTIASWLQSSGFDMRSVMRQLFLSDFFLEEANYSARYRWPVDHLIGTLKALGPGTRPMLWHLYWLQQMNESLYDPPSVEGYRAGETWINSNTMLARTNLSSILAGHRRVALANEVKELGLENDPTAIVDHILVRLGLTKPDRRMRLELLDYMSGGYGAHWGGWDWQLQTKISGLIHLIAGTGDYAFV
jgi:uncharacterized protein (DUF1800 family)